MRSKGAADKQSVRKFRHLAIWHQPKKGLSGPGMQRREEIMKYIVILLASVSLFMLAVILPVSATAPATDKDKMENAAKTDEQPTWEIPIAAGVWYPTDGPVPDKPMRYYRARCWPGCHTGSSYGKYPEKKLRDQPIWPTSTVNAHSTKSSPKE
jgi:hypothetical protein